MDAHAHQITLEPDNSLQLATLCGPLDVHLRQIEKRLGIVIQNRGNDFRLTGEERLIHAAGELLDHMYREVRSGTSMTPELVPRDCIGRWRGIIGFFTGLVSIPAPIIGGFIWEHLGPEWVFIIIVAIDLVIRMPLLYTVPETLDRNRNAES